MTLEEMPAINPLHCFKMRIHVPPLPKGLQKTHTLPLYCWVPELYELLSQEQFVDVAIAYNEKGILFEFDIDDPFHDCFSPSFDKGDAVELFLDTRSYGSSYMTRYCHHFYFLPKMREGIQWEEITKLRSEEARPLADPSSVTVTTTFFEDSYKMRLFLSRDALYGYDPFNHSLLGMHFVVHRYEDSPQYFAFSKKQFKSMFIPSMWAQLQLQV